MEEPTVERAVGLDRSTVVTVGLDGKAVVLRFQGISVKLKPDGARWVAAALLKTADTADAITLPPDRSQ